MLSFSCTTFLFKVHMQLSPRQQTKVLSQISFGQEMWTLAISSPCTAMAVRTRAGVGERGRSYICFSLQPKYKCLGTPLIVSSYTRRSTLLLVLHHEALYSFFRRWNCDFFLCSSRTTHTCHSREARSPTRQMAQTRCQTQSRCDHPIVNWLDTEKPW